MRHFRRVNVLQDIDCKVFIWFPFRGSGSLPRSLQAALVFDICTGLQQLPYASLTNSILCGAVGLLTLQYRPRQLFLLLDASATVDACQSGGYSQASGGRSLRGGLITATFL
jgi:hypothetical protein